MANEKICAECKWSFFQFNWLCTNPKIQKNKDLVTGGEEKIYCQNERFNGEACGKEGKLWEAKP